MSPNYKYSNLNVAVIGCGHWGKNHIRVFHTLDALYTICDTDPNRAALLASQYDIAPLSLENILASPTIDACVIATPAHSHYELAKRCLAAKKHVFIEKPISTHSHHIELLMKEATFANRILMTGHLLHYHEAFRALSALTKNKTLGNVWRIFANRFTFGKLSTETNVIWDVAPHDISMIIALMGEMPYQLSATASHYLPHHTHDIATITLFFSGKRQAQIVCSWIHPVKEQTFTVIGDKAMAVFNDHLPWEQKLVLYQQQHLPATPHPVALHPSEPLTLECQHFLDCILQARTPLTDGQEALYVTQVLEAAIESIHTLSPVSLIPSITDAFKRDVSVAV